MNFNSRNPIISDKALERRRGQMDYSESQVMTVDGAVNKSLMLATIMLLVGIASYALANPVLMIVGAIGGLITVVVSVFKPHLSNITAPLYAVLEGLFVGTVSYMYASAYDGIVFQAITLTMALLFVMLFLYKSGMVKVTDKFRYGVMMATMGVFAVYMINIVLSFFGMNVPFLHEGGMMGIGISLVIIGIACMNLLLDFDNFEKGEKNQMPVVYEWFFAMGLLITLVWLYVEVLRLLSVLNRD